jgi:hypothetical protein
MSAERVAQAAVKVRGRVFTGGNHKEAVVAAALALDLSPMTVWAELGREGQGFTTTRGRWMSRAAAWKLAEKRGQIRYRKTRCRLMPGVVPELHSEELLP